jgi:hypothetical protein
MGGFWKNLVKVLKHLPEIISIIEAVKKNDGGKPS